MGMADSSNGRIALREYLEVRIKELREYVDVRLASIEQATMLARNSMNLRLDSMNEFRAALKDTIARQVSREELAVIVERFRMDIDDLKQYRATMDGKASQSSVNVTLVIAVLSLVLGAVKLLMGG